MSEYFFKNCGVAFSQIPSVLFALRKSKNLTIGQSYLALDLMDYCHNKSTESFDISFKQMQDRTGMNVRTLQDGIKKLIEIGILSHTAQISPQFKNSYSWNMGFLSNTRKNLLTGVSKKHYGGLVKNTKGGYGNLLSLYIESFYNSFRISFRSFFNERDQDGSEFFYTFRNFKSKESKTKNVPRSIAWRNAFNEVLKMGYADPLVRLFIFILSNPELNLVRFPKKFLINELSNGEKYHKFKNKMNYPDWLESDELLIEHLKKEKKYSSFITIGVTNKGVENGTIEQVH